MSLRRYRRYSERRFSERRGRHSDQDSRHYGSIKEDGQDRRGILQEDDEDSDGGCQAPTGPASNVSAMFPHVVPNAATCFRDGRRKIDFVLVYEEPSNGDGSGEGRPTEGRSAKLEAWRERYLENLRKVGLDMEEEIVESDNRKLVHFLKLHATWPVMCHYAEELNMRAPLQVRVYNEAQPNPAENWSAYVLSTLHLPNIMAEDVPCKPLDFYTCPFRRSKIDRFLGSENQQTYFTNVQRSRVLYEILSTVMFGKKKKGEVGIDRLVEEGVFSTAFSLHDGPYHDARATADGPEGCTMNPRQVLYEYWAKWGKWYKYQPLDHIREYFGEKIAIYFAWLGFYTAWLLPAAFVGVLVFLYGLFTMHTNPLANQVCNSEGAFKMCPLCDENLGCKFWDLSDVCGYARLAYLFDHPGTVFYAIFISLWAVTFLEYWKRKCASLAHHWDCTGFQEEEERPRPDFAARAPFLERNPVTGVREPHFPKSLRHKRIAAGIGIIFLMMSLVIIFIIAVIIYRVLVSIPLFQNATFRSQAQSIANLSGAVVNLVLIMAMSRVYEKLAFRLTSWEMHRTQTEFDDNLTFKVFIFQFVNFYSSIFYIAFFKGRFVGYPGNYTLILRLRNEDCSAGGCLIELAQQLAVIMIGKQMINNAQELLVPKIKAWWQKKQVKLSKKRVKTRWEEDYQLIDSEGLFQEYLEMVLQFGFITIFVAAFPLAPLFALLNNWVEIRLDAHKLVCETRRPVAERAENIGIWFKILHMLAHLAVISNGFLIAFTSEFLPKLLYQYEYHWNLEGYVNFTLSYSPDGKLSEQCRYRGLRDSSGKHTPFFWRLLAVRFAFVIIFEHVVFGICRLIDILVPDIPESLELKIKRERYLAKQALQDSDTILRVAVNRGENEDRLPPFGGMVLDLTSELGSLMPPLLIAAPSNSELHRAAQGAMAGPSILLDQLFPMMKHVPKKSSAPPPPEPPKRSNSVRSRPRPRPKTVVEDFDVGPAPRHSMSANALASAKHTPPASAGNSCENTASRSPQSVPDDSIEYATLQGDETGSVRVTIDRTDTMSGLYASGEIFGEGILRKKQRVTVRRKDRPVSEFIGEVLHENGGVTEILRHSVPSRLDHVVVAIPQKPEWAEDLSSSTSSSTSDDDDDDEDDEVCSGGPSLANMAAKSAADVASAHTSAEDRIKPTTSVDYSVASDLSSLVSHDQDSFSDLHLRHASPKKTPIKRLNRDRSNSMGSDMSSLAGQDPESFSDLPMRHFTGKSADPANTISCSIVVRELGASIESDISSLAEQETYCELTVRQPLARASSSREPRKLRQLPSKEHSASVTSAMSTVGQETEAEPPLRRGAACTDITQLRSDARSSQLLSLEQTTCLSTSSELNSRSPSIPEADSLFSCLPQHPELTSTRTSALPQNPESTSITRTSAALPQNPEPLSTRTPPSVSHSAIVGNHSTHPTAPTQAKRVPPPPPPRRRLASQTSSTSNSSIR